MPPEDLISASRDPEAIATLISGLSAYGRLYGLPNSPEQVQGILSTLLRLYRPEQPAVLIEAMTHQVLDGLTPDDLKNAIVDRATSALAKAAHRWQQHLEHQAQGILAAYVQRYRPNLTPEDLRTIVTAVMPLLGEAMADQRPLTRSEALGLISQIVQTFDVSGAIAAAIDPAYLAIAETLATALAQRPMTEAVGETVTAYVKSHAPTLINIGADLIAAALSAVLKNQVDFNIDTQLSVIDENLLIEQVSFQLNILQQSPPPSKAAWAIADQVNTAVEQYRDHRASSVDVTAGLVSGDGLSISSPLTSTRQPGDRPAPDSSTLG
ncbi:hypothetical protein VB780_15985 [Leptolyngbya sp. CCNP1308]|uniref:hypothetical protein n=1 Tax=Leptolyngbya sp. CCNP1308 TaxID=3110255 RepID=UPI002B21F641|nr:hypothetical protein [Leptolyngbya sp. CCNP1308]MEA5450081.1 hypothetical protein [Leptolyngbya sp. CCNP1308]